jgi:hypothetical protein
MTSDEAHWADARALLEEPPSEADLARLRRRVRISWLVVGPLLVAALAARFAAADDARARALTSRAFFLAVPILLVVGLVVSARSGRVERRFESPLSALARHQRRLLLREVQGRAPADPAHLDLARYLAHRLSVPRPAMPISFAGLVLLLARGWFQHPTGPWAALASLATAFFLILAVVGAVQARRARRFLAEHPAAVGDPGREA